MCKDLRMVILFGAGDLYFSANRIIGHPDLAI